MPMADTIEEHDRSTRTLIYGRDKSKKTWWACKAAEAGYHVILVDGDDGSSITKQLPLEARKKILIVNVVDQQSRAVFAPFMASFLKDGNEFYWDENDKRSLIKNEKPVAEHSFIHFKPKLLTTSCVLIVDSWTALADSTKVQYAKEANFDLIAVERDGDQFGLPNFQARFLDFVLSRLHTLPCHVIVIGHEQTWEKYKGAKSDRKLVGTYTQPYSSTGPHAQKLGKHFENVLHFSKLSDTAYRISTVGDDATAGGSRLLAPNRYKWEDITPQTLFSAVGSVATDSDCLGAVYIPPGKIEPTGRANLAVSTNSGPEKMPPQAPVLQGGNSLMAKIKLGHSA